MAEYKVTLSAMNDASTQLNTEANEYMEAADELKKASDALTSMDWQGDASEAWNESMNELYSWMSEMDVVIQGFSTVLKEAAELYDQADKTSASNFGG